MEVLLFIVIVIGLVLFGIIASVAVFMFLGTRTETVPRDCALVISDRGRGVRVAFRATEVSRRAHCARIDLSPKAVRVDCRREEAIPCRDGVRVDIMADFRVRVSPTEEDVTKVVQVIGPGRAMDRGVLNEMFKVRFTEATKAVMKSDDYEEHEQHNVSLPRLLKEQVGRNLGGYELVKVSVIVFSRADGR